ncbi:C45 family autoproteolytic acyltransferase/hydolase [Aquimarina rhabdastrellae]
MLKIKKSIINLLYSILLCQLFLACGISKSIKDRPDITQYTQEVPERIRHNDSTFQVANNYLTKNAQGLWELYVEGDPLEIGLATGKLTQELAQKQEDIFLSKVSEIVPSKTKQKLLRKFLAWYNRKMYLHVKEEYKTEIFGLSRFGADTYDYIAEDYLRMLYLHGAHDIGHALQDLALVGCSSFAVWGNKTVDGSLTIGRNFDFYAGDAFAKEKIIAFVKPDKGHKFMSYTWPGMIGVVSGMNIEGLTVTINAGKSKIPLVAKTPISLLAREILQYASTIEEAVAIAQKRQVFVSEAIMVGSAKDKKAVLIEVAPENFGVYEVPNQEQLICANHFQSKAYKEDERNAAAILESHSQYRYERMTELLNTNDKVDVKRAVEILRNREGLKDKFIGYGNEKALNQLLAHHGIVFKPEQKQVWVSSNPYQLGEFVAYDLNKVFDEFNTQKKKHSVLAKTNLNIPKDTFVTSKAYKNYEAFRKQSRAIQKAIDKKENITEKAIFEFEKLNPNYWETYKVIGDYYYSRKIYKKAIIAYKKALKREVTTQPDVENLQKKIKKCYRRI